MTDLTPPNTPTLLMVCRKLPTTTMMLVALVTMNTTTTTTTTMVTLPLLPLPLLAQAAPSLTTHRRQYNVDHAVVREEVAALDSHS